MHRALFFLAALLLTITSVSADEGRKLTNAELKKIKSSAFFVGGYSSGFGVTYLISSFPDGTRQVYWTNGVTSKIVKGSWRIEGDTVCVKNEGDVSERCNEWHKVGDRFETWSLNAKNGYFYILR